MWQLGVGIELFKKLILKILAIPASSGAVERLFSQCNIRCADRRNRMSQKTRKCSFVMKLKFKLSKFFYFSEKNTIYIIFQNTRNGFCKYTIHEKLDTQFTDDVIYLTTAQEG